MSPATSAPSTESPAGAGPLPLIPGVPIEHEFHDLPAGRFHVARAGDRSLPAILLVHGFPQHWWEWRGVVQALAGEAHLVMPDLRGSGWSAVPTEKGSYKKSEMAKDLGHLLDAMDIDQIAIGAHDWGGFLSQILALDRPEKVSRLLALSIPPVIPSKPAPPLRSLLKLKYQIPFSAPGSNRWLFGNVGFFAKAFRADVRQRDMFTHEDAAVFARQFADPARAKAATMMYRSFVLGDFQAITRRMKGRTFSMPVRFVLSDHDGYIPPEFARQAPNLGDRVDGFTQGRTGHFLPDEDPAYTVELIRDFLLPHARPLG